jgi:hypothetical protein
MNWLVADWRKLWSVWLHGAFALLGGIYAIAPTLDPQIAAMLPASQQMKAIGAYALVGLIVRSIKQKPGG